MSYRITKLQAEDQFSIKKVILKDAAISSAWQLMQVHIKNSKITGSTDLN